MSRIWPIQSCLWVKAALDVTIAIGTGLMVVLGLLGFIFAEDIAGFFEVNRKEVENRIKFQTK